MPAREDLPVKRFAVMMILTASAFAAAARPLTALRPSSQPATSSRPAATTSGPLVPGDQLRGVVVDGAGRTFIVYVPPGLDLKKPAPVVLVFHGAWANARTQVAFSGLNRKADEANFVAVYPNGSGADDRRLFWNAFGPAGGRSPDDVKFVAAILDDLARSMDLDARRVFATGMSNGGMMCYRLAAELSDRIAAIAPVSGTLCIDNPKPKRPVPVVHFHGTADGIVPFDGPKNAGPMALGERLLNFKSVDETISTWVKLDGCPAKPEVTHLPDAAKDGTTVTRKV